MRMVDGHVGELSAETRAYRLRVFGHNLVDLPIKPIHRLLLDEVRRGISKKKTTTINQ